ncbi:hypothetical protein HOY80DRAFT_1002106 [Tuber brumale]|nr:hypothetical protein HOY80DRAFT_1002106 [Tuber brumale]
MLHTIHILTQKLFVVAIVSHTPVLSRIPVNDVTLYVDAEKNDKMRPFPFQPFHSSSAILTILTIPDILVIAVPSGLSGSDGRHYRPLDARSMDCNPKAGFRHGTTTQEREASPPAQYDMPTGMSIK